MEKTWVSMSCQSSSHIVGCIQMFCSTPQLPEPERKKEGNHVLYWSGYLSISLSNKLQDSIFCFLDILDRISRILVKEYLMIIQKWFYCLLILEW